MFLAAVEEATSVMKNVLDTPEPVSREMYLCSNVQLRNLADMIAAQLVYHKEAYEVLSSPLCYMTYPRSLRNLPQQLINSKLKVKLPTVLVAVIHNFPSFHSYCLDVFVYLVDLGSW